MNKSEFEELEIQVRQSGLPLKSCLQKIGVSYSTYHYWRKKMFGRQRQSRTRVCPGQFQTANLSTYSGVNPFRNPEA
ncbi:MAG: hypothetical protein WCU80_08745 [Paludibacteraceae bacterium]